MMVDVLSVEDSLSGVGLGEGLAGGLAVDVVISATVDGEVRLFVDDGSSPEKRDRVRIRFTPSLNKETYLESVPVLFIRRIGN